VDIVVKGRNVEVPDHFRTHVSDKLSKTERYDSKIIRVDVELSHETNRRQKDTCQRVQITLSSKGPAIRAEASADSFYSALDAAITKLETRLRKAQNRRLDRSHARVPTHTVAAAIGELVPDQARATDDAAVDDAAGAETTAAETPVADPQEGPGRIVRIKDHPGDPITVDQALFQMELVGHDFYLFSDADTGLCSVVYRRQGFDYGLLRLTPATNPAH
jgi:ribosomal subunit interface protein